MGTAIAGRRKTPKLSGLEVAKETLFKGLFVEDGLIVRGFEGHDILSWRIGRRRMFSIRHPDYVDHVLHEGVDRYHKSIEYEVMRSVVGLNLFTDEGESWRRHRMMLNPIMAKRHVLGMGELMIDPIATFVDELDRRGDEFELEMAGAMTALTLDVVGAALFGHQFGELANRMSLIMTSGLRSGERAIRLLLVFAPPAWAVRLAGVAIHRSPVLPRSLKRLQWVMRTLDGEVWDLIHERQANPTDSDDLLNLLLGARDEHGPLPRRRVRDEVITFMLAGHETTANAMAWMWHLLALNPDSRDLMLAEVDSVLGGRRPTIEDLPSLPWTTACVTEAMRMYGPAWVIPRVCVEEDEIDGHRIPKGSTVFIAVYALHHDERFWPDPETFDPSRFLPENVKGRHRSAYLPFGGGRRVCIGTSFALVEMTLITAMMSQGFGYDAVPGHPVEPEATFTLRPRDGIRMIARRR
jgi:cytochrome P450